MSDAGERAREIARKHALMEGRCLCERGRERTGLSQCTLEDDIAAALTALETANAELRAKADYARICPQCGQIMGPLVTTMLEQVVAERDALKAEVERLRASLEKLVPIVESLEINEKMVTMFEWSNIASDVRRTLAAPPGA